MPSVKQALVVLAPLTMLACAAPTAGDASASSEAAVSPVGEDLVGDPRADLELRLCYDTPREGTAADGTCDREVPPLGTDGSPGGPQAFAGESAVSGRRVFFSVRAPQNRWHMNTNRGLAALDAGALSVKDIVIEKVGSGGRRTSFDWSERPNTKPFWPAVFAPVDMPGDGAAGTYRVTVTVLKGGQVRGYAGDHRLRAFGWNAPAVDGWHMIGTGRDRAGDPLNLVEFMETWQNPETMELVVANARKVTFDVAVIDDDG